MKKALLFVALIAAASVSARTVKLTMSDYFTEDEQKSKFVVTDADKGITLTATKGTYGSQSGYFAATGDVRVQFGGTLTVTTTDPHITAIEFIISSQGKERLPELSVTTGTATVTNDPDYSATWSGSAQSVVFTVGDNNYGSKTKEKGQLCFTAIRIETDGTGDDDDDTPDLTKEYPITQGRAFFYGTSYSTNNNFMVELYSDGISFGTQDGDETIEGTGTYATFDLYTTDGKSFIGSYASGKGTNAGALATGSSNSSQWHVCGRGNCASAVIQSGSISITCTESGKYNVTYDVVDSEGNSHKATVKGLTINVKQENGSNYAVSNTCTDSDAEETALSTTELSNQIFVENGEIVVECGAPADVAIYSLLGQKIGEQRQATHFQQAAQAGIYVVRIGNHATKIVVK